MQNLKNILVGFIVSFLGSIPLGYLNVIGFDVYNSKGLYPTLYFLLGVICVEFLVIYGTLFFANKLNSNHKLLKFIEGFSIVFLFILAYIFYSSANNEVPDKAIFSIIANSFFISGMLYSCFNFIQIPFWLSWNLYLLNSKYINFSKSPKFVYIIGTTIGTFIGMLTLILALHYFASNVDFLSQYLIMYIIPIVFILLALIQSYKFYKKYK